MTNDQMKANRFRRIFVARKKLAWINERIEEGRTVFVSTYGKHTKITAKNVAAFKAAGAEMFQATKTGLYIARGRNWDCIDYCKITAQ